MSECTKPCELRQRILDELNGIDRGDGKNKYTVAVEQQKIIDSCEHEWGLWGKTENGRISQWLGCRKCGKTIEQLDTEFTDLRAQLEAEINQHGLDNLQLVEERNEARTERNEYKAKLEAAEKSLSYYKAGDDSFTDDNGVVWERPTAEAYYRVCQARNKWQERAEAAEKENLSLRTSRNDQRQNNRNLKDGIKYWQNRCAEIMKERDELQIKLSKLHVEIEEETDKLKLQVSQQDATIASMRDFVKKMFCEIHCEFKKDGCVNECLVKEALASAPITRLERIEKAAEEVIEARSKWVEFNYDNATPKDVIKWHRTLLTDLTVTINNLADALKREEE